jgi:hypothetical protein
VSQQDAVAVALKDRMLLLLSTAVIISLAFGLFQDSGPMDCAEGAAIMIAVPIVVGSSIRSFTEFPDRIT